MSKFTVTAKKLLPQLGEEYKPHTYQKKAIKFLLEHAAAALFLDPGLGKTSITLAAFKFLLGQGMAKGMLVVAPLRPAKTVWPKEVKKWRDFHGLDLVLLHGPAKEKDALVKHDVYVVNYEGFLWLTRPIPKEQGGKTLDDCILKRMIRAGLVDTIVFDELSKMKETETKRYKKIERWLPLFNRRWGLTGSPAANGLLNLFGQCYVLDLGTAFGRYVTHFRAKYFSPTGSFAWEVTPGAEKLIYERLKPLALRMDADDYLKLPKLRQVTVYYDLPDELRPAYTELEEELYTFLDQQDVEIAAVNNGVVSNKLRQFASGALYRVPVDPITGVPKARKDNTYDVLHNEKLEAFQDLVEELQGQQILVAYEFQHDVDRAAKWFPKSSGLFWKDGRLPAIGGGTSAKDGAELEALWNAGKLPWLWGQWQSIAYGLNLQESDACNIISFTQTWDYELYDQLVRRLRRQGNKAPVLNVYHMIGRDTVEEDVAATIVRKKRRQDELLIALKDRRQRGVVFDTQFNEAKNATMAAKQRKAQADARKKAAAQAIKNQEKRIARLAK